MEVGLSLGSNLGDRLVHLARARQAIARLPGVDLLASSPVYETEPVGVRPRFRHLAFLNAVVVVESALAPQRLLDELHAIEADLGRARAGGDRNAPRPIDIDVLYAGAERIVTPDLTVPHPRWAERRFVVQPLADVRPDRVLPGEARPVRAVLLSLPDEPKVILFKREW
jgi:2-amino-4-hydroxy-6-hydroxymethyldihydropteridine diphosphokinase